jgi:hypothetical protein
VTALRNALLVLHFIGIGALLGGFLTQLSAGSKRIVNAMLHGALTMLVSGLGLYFTVKNGLHDPVGSAKIGVKFAVLVVILGLIWTNREKESISKGVFFAIGGLTVANIVIAVFWS